jgi:predicted transposase/invertase (TIGR01784 family)
MAKIYLEKDEDVIDICLDIVFKAVFTKETAESTTALETLLSAIIGRRVKILGMTVNEPPAHDRRDKQIRYDINCKIDGGEPVNLEITLSPEDFDPYRLEFYAGKLFTGQDITGGGKTYSDLKEAYQITILVKRRYFEDGELLHRFKYYDAVNGVELGGRSRIITMELSKVNEGAGALEMSAAERWAYYLRNVADKRKRDKVNDIIAIEEGISMANSMLTAISRDDAERARLISELKFELDTRSRLVAAEQRVAAAEQRAEQRVAAAEQKAEQKAEQRAVAVEQEVRREMARALKVMGLPAEQISRAAGLSTEEIEAL